MTVLRAIAALTCGFFWIPLAPPITGLTLAQ